MTVTIYTWADSLFWIFSFILSPPYSLKHATLTHHHLMSQLITHSCCYGPPSQKKTCVTRWCQLLLIEFWARRNLLDRAPSVQLLNPIFSILCSIFPGRNLVFAGILEIPLFPHKLPRYWWKINMQSRVNWWQLYWEFRYNSIYTVKNKSVK